MDQFGPPGDPTVLGVAVFAESAGDRMIMDIALDQCGARDRGRTLSMPTKPRVMILTYCSDGHQVEMFPEKVIRIVQIGHALKAVVKWECPRCEKGGVNEVEL